jgi:fatty acid desaturase
MSTIVSESPVRWDKLAHQAVRDLHEPRPSIFWTDLLLSAGAGYVAMLVAMTRPLLDPVGVAAAMVAAMALYRALCFMHEIAHLRPGALPGFETAWNVLVGAPLLMPSFVYTHGVHQNHHSLGTYGTTADPEYLPFASSHVMTVTFALHSALIPLALVVRFVGLGTLALLVPALHRALVGRASALAMHPNFVRVPTPLLLQKAFRWQAAIASLWGVALLLTASGYLPWRIFATWYIITAVVSIVNVLRTLGAHHYEGDGHAMDRTAQLLDSVETPGAWWTEVWAPVGLRYHALHHYFPGIPYHHLPEAHRRLVAALPGDATFKQTLSPSLPRSLGRLLATGYARSRGGR